MTDISLKGRCGVTGKPVEIIVTPENLQTLAGALQGVSAKEATHKTMNYNLCGAVVINGRGECSPGACISSVVGETLCRACLDKGQIKRLQQSLADAQRMIKNRNSYIEHQELSHASEMGELQRNLAAAEKLLEEEKAAKEEAELKWITASDEVTRRLVVELYDMIYAGEDPKEREPRWKWVVAGVSSLIERIKSQEAELDVIQGKAEKAMRDAYELQKKLDAAVAAGAMEIKIADKLGAENKGLKEQVEKLKEALKNSTVKAVCHDCRELLYDAGEVQHGMDGKDYCRKCVEARRTKTKETP